MSAKQKIKDTLFVDEFELEIEKATYRNIDRLTSRKYIDKSHEKIASVLKDENQTDNKYMNYDKYVQLVNECKEKKEKAREKAKQREEKKKAKEAEKKQQQQHQQQKQH